MIATGPGCAGINLHPEVVHLDLVPRLDSLQGPDLREQVLDLLVRVLDHLIRILDLLIRRRDLRGHHPQGM